MARKLVDSSALSFFCDSLSVMLAAGIQTDEAVHMLIEDMDNTPFRATCQKVYRRLNQGDSLATSLELTEEFPQYVVDMIDVGERAGKLESVLRSLGVYYNEESRMFDKVKSSIGYPAALFCIMSVILAFTIGLILPVFVNVYESISGNLVSSSYGFVSVAIGIGWFVLALTLLATIIALIGVAMTRSANGRQSLMRMCEKFPLTKDAMYELALSRLLAALAAYTASGMNSDDAMRESINVIDNELLHKNATQAYEYMVDLNHPRSLAQALDETGIVESIYVRMLTIGSRTGSLESVLGRLSDMFFTDALSNIDRAVDVIEPSLAGFLTIAVGATLISVMLPLIGIMGSIG